MRSQEAKIFSNIGADTANFELYGGKYQIAVLATFGGGNVVMEQVGPDGTTYLPVHTAITAAGVAIVEVPPGQFRFNLTTASAVYASVVRIPGE